MQPQTAVPIDVVGFILTAISVLVVYHMFSLQSWLASVTESIHVAERMAEREVISDFERREVQGALRRARWSFPIFQTAVLFAAIGALAYVNLLAARQIAVAYTFTVLPTLLLCAVIILATAGALLTAQIRLTRARRR